MEEFNALNQHIRGQTRRRRRLTLIVASANATIVAHLPKLVAVAKWAHIEKLQEFDGQPSDTKTQGKDQQRG